MKKTLAIILSAAMVLSMMVGMFTFAVTTSADEAPLATYVKVYPATGDAVTLNAEKTTFNGTTGTAVFDAAKGELTITDLTGVKQIAGGAGDDVDGSLTVVVKGTNTIESDDQPLFLKRYQYDDSHQLIYTKDKENKDVPVRLPASLTIKGDGTLNATGKRYLVGCQDGNLTVEGSVKLNITAKTGDAIHVAGSSCGAFGLTLKDNVVLTLKDDGTAACASLIRVVDLDGASVMKDNAVVTVTNAKASGWEGR